MNFNKIKRLTNITAMAFIFFIAGCQSKAVKKYDAVQAFGCISEKNFCDSKTESMKNEKEIKYLLKIKSYYYNEDGEIFRDTGILLKKLVSPNVKYEILEDWRKNNTPFVDEFYQFVVSDDNKFKIESYYLLSIRAAIKENDLELKYEGKFEFDKPFELYRYLPNGWDEKIFKKVSDIEFSEDK